MLLQGKTQPLDENSRTTLLCAHESMAEGGLRVIMTAIIAMQVVNVFLCRSPLLSAFSRSHRRNRLIGDDIVFEILLLLEAAAQNFGAKRWDISWQV